MFGGRVMVRFTWAYARPLDSFALPSGSLCSASTAKRSPITSTFTSAGSKPGSSMRIIHSLLFSSAVIPLSTGFRKPFGSSCRESSLLVHAQTAAFMAVCVGLSGEPMGFGLASRPGVGITLASLSSGLGPFAGQPRCLTVQGRFRLLQRSGGALALLLLPPVILDARDSAKDSRKFEKGRFFEPPLVVH